jgi:hypothetical protein
MAQTAITKAIKELKEKIENSNYALYALGCEDAIEILTDLLTYERETIEAAYKDGGINSKAMAINGFSNYNNSQDYFDKTYTN